MKTLFVSVLSTFLALTIMVPLASALDVEVVYASCERRDATTDFRWQSVWPCTNGDRITIRACLIPEFVGEGGGASVTIYDPEYGYELSWRRKPFTVLLFAKDGRCKRVFRTRLARPRGNHLSPYPQAEISLPVAVIPFSAIGGAEGQPDISYISFYRGCEGIEDEFGNCLPEATNDPAPDSGGGGGGKG